MISTYPAVSGLMRYFSLVWSNPFDAFSTIPFRLCWPSMSATFSFFRSMDVTLLDVKLNRIEIRCNRSARLGLLEFKNSKIESTLQKTFRLVFFIGDHSPASITSSASQCSKKTSKYFSSVKLIGYRPPFLLFTWSIKSLASLGRSCSQSQ